MDEDIRKTIVSVARNYREAPLRPASVNVDDRTVEVVWATTAPVLRAWPDGELYWEVLSLDPAHIELARFAKGLSVLDAHNRDTTKSIYGIAENPVFPGGGNESLCRARFSKNNADADRVFREIQDGIIRHWSFGYDVLRMVRAEKEIDGLPVYKATLWEPFELSIVPVPADPSAGVRMKDSKSRSCEVIDYRGVAMTDEEKKRQEEEEKKKRQEEEEEKAKKEAEEEEKKKKKGKKESEEEEEKERSLGQASTIHAEERARAAERRRIGEIRAAFQALPAVMKESEMDEFIDSDRSADDFRRALLDAARSKQPPIASPGDVAVGRESREKKREAMSFAILHRAAPGQYKAGNSEFGDIREFRGMKLIDMAKECLDDAGVKWRGHSSEEVFKMAFGSARDMHATTDFPILLMSTINKSLRDSYTLVQPTYEAFCRRASVKDFKERNLVQLGDVGKFQKIVEGGEYKATTVGEAIESYRVYKYGTLFGITWEALINDDLDAFSRVPMSITAESVQHCADIVYDILLKNPKMGDGKALFHADHGNLGTAADIDLPGMDAAFTAMGTQKNGNGRILNLHPEFLLFGHHKRTKALQYLNDTVVPTKSEDVTPAQMRGLTPIVEGRIDGNKWFLACSPGLIDTIEYAYLEGEEGLYTEERWGFEVDGLEIKARLVFGAKAIDWRGLYMNPGL